MTRRNMTEVPDIDNARYIGVVQPNDEDLRELLQKIKIEMRAHPDRPVVVIIYREVPKGDTNG